MKQKLPFVLGRWGADNVNRRRKSLKSGTVEIRQAYFKKGRAT